jgi:DNA repair protein RadC
MKTYPENLSIRYWSEDDKPREKLAGKGRMALSDAELMAILIGSGNKEDSAVDLSKKILNHVNGNLIELSRMSINDLMSFKGIGKAKAITIIAAIELGRRRRESEAREKKKITCSRDVFELIQSKLSDNHYEAFWIILLNRANNVLKEVNISEGGLSGTIADPKKIFKMALDNHAASIILCHNHPSGNIKPSEADIKLTKKLKEAGNLLEISILDHLIVGEENYFSFADEGMI